MELLVDKVQELWQIYEYYLDRSGKYLLRSLHIIELITEYRTFMSNYMSRVSRLCAFKLSYVFCMLKFFQNINNIPF